MFDYLFFYIYQLAIGAGLGLACAVLGVFVILRGQTLFAATLSQAGTLAFAIVVLFHERFEREHGAAHFAGNWQVPLLSVLLMLPFFVLFRGRRRFRYQDAALVAGLVGYSALSQILSVAGGLHTHLLTAYFGNILTVGAGDVIYALPVLLISAGVFVWNYRSWLSLSFDADHARLAGVSVDLVDFLFFAVLATVSALTIRLMGSFYALAHLILPALFALTLCRTIRMALPVAALYSCFATLGGFLLSLAPLTLASGQEIHLPTSSVIIVLLGVGLLLAFLVRRFVLRPI